MSILRQLPVRILLTGMVFFISANTANTADPAYAANPANAGYIVNAAYPVYPAYPAEDHSGENWVEKSNGHAAILLGVQATHSPEYAAGLGLDGFDEEITDFSPGFMERQLEDLEQVKTELESRYQSEPEGPVRQDLQIMIGYVDDQIRSIRLEYMYLLPFFDLPSVIYSGLRNLLEDRIPDERRQSAAIRLSKYVGREGEHAPVTELAMNYFRKEWERDDRLPPFREEVERSLSTTSSYMEEIGVLFQQYRIEGVEEELAMLEEQLHSYNLFIRTEILPRSRDSFRLPDELYEHSLKKFGVDMPLDQLVGRARVSFKELQAQMQVLAGPIAEKNGFPSGDYREVIRSLKKEVLDSAAILPFYRDQIGTIEEIIHREGIVTLPDRDMVIRLATPAESAASPAPFMSPPRLIGNTGEYGEFVLPLKVTGGSEGSALKVDDFMHKAASWALTAHEGRPGHELQFTSIVERGVSQARMIFAMNSVNVEGWALYMEEQILPFVPMEGQFMILWSRMVRAARAFLDPGLNTGAITTEEAKNILRNELVLSEALVRSELERYRFRAPGQATSYFNGYVRMMELRAETELIMGKNFDQMAFHDFILTQGLLPPALIREAVLREFVPAQR